MKKLITSVSVLIIIMVFSFLASPKQSYADVSFSVGVNVGGYGYNSYPSYGNNSYGSYYGSYGNEYGSGYYPSYSGYDYSYPSCGCNTSVISPTHGYYQNTSHINYNNNYTNTYNGIYGGLLDGSYNNNGYYGDPYYGGSSYYDSYLMNNYDYGNNYYSGYDYYDGGYGSSGYPVCMSNYGC